MEYYTKHLALFLKEMKNKLQKMKKLKSNFWYLLRLPKVTVGIQKV